MQFGVLMHQKDGRIGVRGLVCLDQMNRQLTDEQVVQVKVLPRREKMIIRSTVEKGWKNTSLSTFFR